MHRALVTSASSPSSVFKAAGTLVPKVSSVGERKVVVWWARDEINRGRNDAALAEPDLLRPVAALFHTAIASRDDDSRLKVLEINWILKINELVVSKTS